MAAAEALPTELDGAAGALSIHFPWGSLLRGLVDPSPTILRGIARVLRPDASVTALLSISTHDGGAPLRSASIDRVAYARCGLEIVEWRPATPAEVAASDSSWAKRLRAGKDRAVWYLHARDRKERRAAFRRPSLLTSEGRG